MYQQTGIPVATERDFAEVHFVGDLLTMIQQERILSEEDFAIMDRMWADCSAVLGGNRYDK